MFDAFESETRRSVFDAAKRVNRNRFGQRQDNNDKCAAANQAARQLDLRLRKRNDFRAKQKVKRDAADEHERMGHEPEFIGTAGFDFFLRFLFPGRARQLGANFRFFLKLFLRFGHQLWNRISDAKRLQV